MPARVCPFVMALATGAACGRLDFDPLVARASDGSVATDTPIVGVTSLVQIQSAGNFASGGSVMITSTAAGDALAVAITVNGANDVVSAVADDRGDAFISAGVRAAAPVDPGGAAVTEVWYAVPIAGGATQVTVTTAGGSFLWDATVLELHGVAASNPVDVAGEIGMVPGTTTSGPGVALTTTSANDSIVELSSGSYATMLTVGSAFTGLRTAANDSIAYLVGTHPVGTYEADWTCTQNCGQYSVSAVAFRPQ